MSDLRAVSSPNSTVFLNPRARDGKGLEENERIIATLRENSFPNVQVVAELISDAERRQQSWGESIYSNESRVLFPAGGDGTVLEVTEAALRAGAQKPKNIADLFALRMPAFLEYICGIGTGSAQDIKAVLDFPTPDALATFLNHDKSNHEVFQLGAVWMVSGMEDGQFQQAHLVNHSLIYGLGSYVFQLREEAVQKWKSKAENRGKPVPWHLNTIWGRALRAPRAIFHQIADFTRGSRGYSIRLRFADGSEKYFNNTANFALFTLPVVANFFGVPQVNPLAGENFKALVMALPNDATSFLIAAEGLLRGFLAKKLGMANLVGPQANFLTLKFLNSVGTKMGFWDPSRVMTLKHGDILDVEVMDRTSKNGIKDFVPHTGLPLLNGDLAQEKQNRFRIVVGPQAQTLPLLGHRDSILGQNTRAPLPPSPFPYYMAPRWFR